MSEITVPDKDLNSTQESDENLGKPLDRRGRTLTDDQSIIFNRYNNWKNNLMALYNHIEFYALPYPARTVQFLPNAKNIVSSKNQYKGYTNYPFIYPSNCTVPKQERSVQIANKHLKAKTKSNTNQSQDIRSTKRTPIYYLQSMNYFTPNRIEQQEHLWDIFHDNDDNKNAINSIDLSNIKGINNASLTTNILPYDKYMCGGACVESAYDVYRLRIMPQQPHLIATRSYHEDIAIYWMDYNNLPKPLNAFENIRNKHYKNNSFPERSGLSLSDDDDDDDDDDGDDDIRMKNTKKRKRDFVDGDNEKYPTKRQKLNNNNYQYDNDEDEEDDEDDDNPMDIQVGSEHGYLIAVGQASVANMKTGWGLAFNPNHAGMFITGNGNGCIAVWDLNMVDNSTSMTKMGKFKNKTKSSDPNSYMINSKIRNKNFNDGPPFISREKCDEYLWFEEFEKYGTYSTNSSSSTINPDIMSVDWCHDSSNIFISSSKMGKICVWDRRNADKKKPVLWTWGTSHNQSVLSVSWNPIQHSLIASGSKDIKSSVRIWDIRSFNSPLISLKQHQSDVYHVAWCPYNKYLLASSSSNGVLLMYDLRRVGLEDEDDDDGQPQMADGIKIKDEKKNNDSMTNLLEDISNCSVGNMYNKTCPELVFAHCGHTACIPEFDWCPSGDLTMISTDMDGIVHTWQPPSGMIDTFSWVLHSQRQNYIIKSTKTTTMSTSTTPSSSRSTSFSTSYSSSSTSTTNNSSSSPVTSTSFSSSTTTSASTSNNSSPHSHSQSHSHSSSQFNNMQSPHHHHQMFKTHTPNSSSLFPSPSTQFMSSSTNSTIASNSHSNSRNATPLLKTPQSNNINNNSPWT